jgi:hypothetical protein
MSDPIDNRDDTVPAPQVAPISFVEDIRASTDKLLQMAYRSFGVPSKVLCGGTMFTPVIRDDSTPPARPNSGNAAPIDFDAYE